MYNKVNDVNIRPIYAEQYGHDIVIGYAVERAEPDGYNGFLTWKNYGNYVDLETARRAAAALGWAPSWG